MEIRCGTCSKKLGDGIYKTLRIKCPRCKTMNFLRAESSTPEHHECQCRNITRENIQKRTNYPS